MSEKTGTGVGPLRLEFCGERYTVEPDRDFHIGRESDLTIDDNPYLHRRFLRLHAESAMWWLTNVGNLLSATVSDATGQVQAWLAPGARLPVVFPELHVLFTAGATTYDFTIENDARYFDTSATIVHDAGATTFLPVSLTPSQKLLVLSLAEDVLRQSVPGRGAVPSSADAATRLGWSMTTFNRKLDNVCDKLDKLGVPGLRGGRNKLASNRKARLVEYAVTTHLVGPDDLPLLDATGAEPAD